MATFASRSAMRSFQAETTEETCTRQEREVDRLLAHQDPAEVHAAKTKVMDYVKNKSGVSSCPDGSFSQSMLL